MLEKNRSKFKIKAKEIKKEIRQKISGYILAAFGFVAALAWNDAIKSLIEYFFPLNKNTVLPKFVYAVLITVVIVIISIYLTKLLEEKKQAL